MTPCCSTCARPMSHSTAGWTCGFCPSVSFTSNNTADEALPCPHGRAHWGHCPHCLGLNTYTLAPEPVTPDEIARLRKIEALVRALVVAHDMSLGDARATRINSIFAAIRAALEEK